MTKNLFSVSFLLVCFCLSMSAQSADSSHKTYRFDNGRWFDGQKFTTRTFYSVDGILSSRKPPTVDKVVDLKNGFVIPPFGDAHTHNLDGTFNLKGLTEAYIDEGTFYVQVLGNNATGAQAARPLLNKPSTLDAIYANGMLTCTYGHPFMVYEPLALGIYNPVEARRRIVEVKKSRLAENNAYWFLDNTADVDAKWPKILATKPDVIKIGLLDAENYDKHLAAGDMTDKGLSPKVAGYVVKKARLAGLRVFAHIETAADFRLGLRLGVAGFAHAPGYGWDGRGDIKSSEIPTTADLKLAAKLGVIVIPTAKRGELSVTDFTPAGKPLVDEARLARIVERQKNLFSEMRRHGVKIAFGHDFYGATVLPEILYFHQHNIFDNRTLLKIAVEDTPSAIFPNRKIGRLREGYEASFLVLKGDPLKDFAQVKNIESRFKQGVFIGKD